MRYVFFAFGAAAITACAPLAEEPSSRPTVAILGDVQPMCQAGCVELDPNPTAPGVFLSSAVTPDMCFDGGYTDADHDLLGDKCERDIAMAFAPELKYWNYDVVGREPRWVARPIEEGGQLIVYVGYLLSYYRDAGNSSFGCQTFPFLEPSCNGHNGDSEAIWLKAYYDAETQHWVLHQARYSQHAGEGVFNRGSNPFPPQLIYPDHAGSYPRAYVSIGKHANYQSIDACNSGGFGNSDTCDGVNTTARVFVSASRDIGSRNTHTYSQDCSYSQDPGYLYYNGGREECYWTLRDFQGWIPDSVGGPPSSPYSTILSNHGF